MEKETLVNLPAIRTDLATAPCKRAKVPNLHHGVGKISSESCGVGAISGDLRVRGAAIEELLVGMQEAFFIH